MHNSNQLNLLFVLICWVTCFQKNGMSVLVLQIWSSFTCSSCSYGHRVVFSKQRIESHGDENKCQGNSHPYHNRNVMFFKHRQPTLWLPLLSDNRLWKTLSMKTKKQRVIIIKKKLKYHIMYYLALLSVVLIGAFDVFLFSISTNSVLFGCDALVAVSSSGWLQYWWNSAGVVLVILFIL